MGAAPGYETVVAFHVIQRRRGSMSDTRTLSRADLEALSVRALVACNTSPENARSVARNLIQAEIDGRKGHGFWRVPIYAGQARAGKVKGHAVPAARQTRPAAVMIDAGQGFAYPALDLAVDELTRIARETGIAAAGITRSNHAGAIGIPIETLADRGLIALAFANSFTAMSAWGGKTGVFGTNPIAFAAPRAGQPSLVIDMALSKVARANITTALARGESIPDDWAVDKDGRPTTDPKKAMEGLSLPAGGAKGAALALMVELLAAALTGSNLAPESSSFLDDKGAPCDVGQMLIAIDPGAFGGGDVFASRFATLAGWIEDDPGARLPGTRRLPLRETAAREGIAVDAKVLGDVTALAGPAG